MGRLTELDRRFVLHAASVVLLFAVAVAANQELQYPSRPLNAGNLSNSAGFEQNATLSPGASSVLLDLGLASHRKGRGNIIIVGKPKGHGHGHGKVKLSMPKIFLTAGLATSSRIKGGGHGNSGGGWGSSGGGGGWDSQVGFGGGPGNGGWSVNGMNSGGGAWGSGGGNSGWSGGGNGVGWGHFGNSGGGWGESEEGGWSKECPTKKAQKAKKKAQRKKAKAQKKNAKGWGGWENSVGGLGWRSSVHPKNNDNWYPKDPPAETEDDDTLDSLEDEDWTHSPPPRREGRNDPPIPTAEDAFGIKRDDDYLPPKDSSRRPGKNKNGRRKAKDEEASDLVEVHEGSVEEMAPKNPKRHGIPTRRQFQIPQLPHSLPSFIQLQLICSHGKGSDCSYVQI